MAPTTSFNGVVSMDGAVTLSYNYTAVATADVPEPTALLLAATATGLV